MVRSLSLPCALAVVLLVPVVARAEKKEFTNLSIDEVTKQYNELSEKGWTPVKITGKASGKDSVYDMTWVDDRIGGWYIYAGMTTKEFQDKKDEMKKDGLKLHQESSWKVAGQDRCAGVWIREPDGRAVWAYKNNGNYFEHKRGKLWEEVKDKKVVNTFIEQTRNKEFVELYDKGREVTVRLYAGHSDLKPAGAKAEFKHYSDGKWGTK
jgi:hypothetical protein